MAFRPSARLARNGSGEAPRLVINGRFLEQALSGVQRFAYKMTSALVGVGPETHRSPIVLRPAHMVSEDAPFSVQCVG